MTAALEIQRIQHAVDAVNHPLGYFLFVVW